mmetsp:Transcript_102569/g.313654  ORF Transcript_102569/g.313654 Transcript_102569/m.313654 type:complete len:219 (-) Transcript_102569:213-869(-)
MDLELKVLFFAVALSCWKISAFSSRRCASLARFMMAWSADLLQGASSGTLASSVPWATTTNSLASCPVFTTWSPWRNSRLLACCTTSDKSKLLLAIRTLRFAFARIALLTKSCSSGSSASPTTPAACASAAAAAAPSMAGRGGNVIFLCRPRPSKAALDSDIVVSGSGPAAQTVATIGRWPTRARAPKKSPRTSSVLTLDFARRSSSMMTRALPEATR